MTRNKLLMTCAVASLALGLSACSSDDDAPVMMTSMMDQEPALTPAEMLVAAQSSFDAAQEAVDNLAADATPEEIAAAHAELAAAKLALTVAENLPKPPLTELQAAQTAASDAATAAMTAAVTANTSADDADTARVNIATMQTGETSGGHAYMARHYADIAQTAYMAAKTASEAAADATTVSAAVEARVAAQAAMAEAVAAEADATFHAGLSMTAVNAELLIDGTVKTVGGTSIDADVGATENIVGGKTTKTGEVGKVMVTGAAVPGVEFVQAVPATPGPAVAGVAHKQAVEARQLTIGKTVDSANDMARLMIVTHYVGTKSVRVYAEHAAALDGTPAMLVGPRLSDGRIQIAGVLTPATDDDRFATLTPVGTYYLATTDPEADTGDGAEGEALDNTDIVGAKAKAERVYSFVAEAETATDADRTGHAVLQTESTTDGVTTFTYQPVGITVDGPVPVMDGVLETDGDAKQMPVTAAIPEATAYKHIHFGVWADLPAADEAGLQTTLADLGIGFVQNFSDSGRTGADMPNNGDAQYGGNWVAAVRAADEDGNGDISLKKVTATLDANFEKGTIGATLISPLTKSGASDSV